MRPLVLAVLFVLACSVPAEAGCLFRGRKPARTAVAKVGGVAVKVVRFVFRRG